MRQGIISVHPETTLRPAVKLMAERRVDAIAISSVASDDRSRGIASAVEVVAAAAIDATLDVLAAYGG